jgi:hypothetical protein
MLLKMMDILFFEMVIKIFKKLKRKEEARNLRKNYLVENLPLTKEGRRA